MPRVLEEKLGVFVYNTEWGGLQGVHFLYIQLNLPRDTFDMLIIKIDSVSESFNRSKESRVFNISEFDARFRFVDVVFLQRNTHKILVIVSSGATVSPINYS